MEKEEKKLTEKWKDVVTDYLKALSQCLPYSTNEISQCIIEHPSRIRPKYKKCEISGSQGSKYEYNFLGCSVMQSRGSRLTFQRYILPPSSEQ
jgi:hypothetical protein